MLNLTCTDDSENKIDPFPSELNAHDLIEQGRSGQHRDDKRFQILLFKRHETCTTDGGVVSIGDVVRFYHAENEVSCRPLLW